MSFALNCNFSFNWAAMDNIVSQILYASSMFPLSMKKKKITRQKLAGGEWKHNTNIPCNF